MLIDTFSSQILEFEKVNQRYQFILNTEYICSPEKFDCNKSIVKMNRVVCKNTLQKRTKRIPVSTGFRTFLGIKN